MVWIKLICLIFISFSLEAAPTPSKLLTKHALESIRYISMNGRFAYVKKRPGVLGLVSYFRSADFLTDKEASDFLVKASRARNRVAIEVIPNTHTEPNFFKNHRILSAKYGETETKEVGLGINAQLHLNDEWISYYDAYQRIIFIQNLITQKKYQIRPSNKPNAFFIPDVHMINPEVVVYTDINEQGVSAALSFNLLTQKSSVIYKASQSATGLELCSGNGYLALGEFPFEGVARSSQILKISTANTFNLASYTTLYNSVDQDLGNMVCLDDSIYFVKTMNQDRKLGIKTTEAVKLTLSDSQVTVKTTLNSVTQLLEMDGRVMTPFRGDYYVLEGEANLGTDTLKGAPTNSKEELPLEI